MKAQIMIIFIFIISLNIILINSLNVNIPTPINTTQYNVSYSNSTNYSEILITTAGNIDNVNITQFEESGGFLNILESWLLSFLVPYSGATKFIDINGQRIGNASNPINPQDYVTKNYTDNIASAIAFDFFFTNHTSDITGHYNLEEIHDEHNETSLTSASLSAGSHNIFNFTTKLGQPEFAELRAGVYDARLHLFRTGTKSVTITPKLYNMSADGSSKTLLITFETSIELTTIDATYDLHGVLTEEVIIPLDNRLHMEFVADVGSSGGNPTVTLDMEGTTDTHLSIETSSNAFEQIFLRQDGTTPLTGDWNYGPFDLNGSGDVVTTGKMGAKIFNVTANITDELGVAISHNATCRFFWSPTHTGKLEVCD